LLAPLEFVALALKHGRDRALIDGERVDDFVVEHAHAARRERTHRELLAPGDSELAHDERIERRVQSARNLVRHRDASPWNPENDDVVAVCVAREITRELASRRATACEACGHPALYLLRLPAGDVRYPHVWD